MAHLVSMGAGGLTLRGLLDAIWVLVVVEWTLTMVGEGRRGEEKRGGRERLNGQDALRFDPESDTSVYILTFSSQHFFSLHRSDNSSSTQL